VIQNSNYSVTLDIRFLFYVLLCFLVLALIWISRDVWFVPACVLCGGLGLFESVSWALPRIVSLARLIGVWVSCLPLRLSLFALRVIVRSISAVIVCCIWGVMLPWRALKMVGRLFWWVISVVCGKILRVRRFVEYWSERLVVSHLRRGIVMIAALIVDSFIGPGLSLVEKCAVRVGVYRALSALDEYVWGSEFLEFEFH
jgi:hypothetical protein